MAAGHSIRARTRFKAVKGFTGYYIGSDGSVWSTWHRVYRRAFRVGVSYREGGPWVRMRTNTVGWGYQDVQLRLNGGGIHVLVHRLVLLAFRGEPPTPFHECAHWDGDPANNRIENLRWATKSENQADRWRHGTRRLGPRRKHG